MIKADSELASSLDSRPGELVVVDVVFVLLYFSGLIKKISFHAREERKRERERGRGGVDLKNFRSQKRVFENADLILIFVFLPFGPSLFSLSFKIYFFSLINMLRLSVSISFFFLAYFTTTLV